VVTNEADARHASFIGTVVSRGYQIYLTDGTELSPK
jgi:hypothetical protein